MLRCSWEDPFRRPTFTEFREEQKGIMIQGEMCISFDFAEDAN